MATNQEYKNLNYDRLAIWIKKGRREEYKNSAAGFGLSLSALIQNGVEEYIRNHGGEAPTVITQQPEQKLSPEQRRLVEEFNKLPTDARRALVKFLQTLNAGNKPE